MKSKLIFILVLLFLVPLSFADNWVCYDSSTGGTLTEATLRARFPTQPGSPLQIIRTGSQNVPIYTTAVYFRDCGSSSFTYCPENNYLMKTIFTEISKCTSFGGSHHEYYWNDINAQCGLGGSPYCTSWSSSSSAGTSSYVCGTNNDKWKTMTASNNWDCPTCKELAVRQNGVVPTLDLSSFDMLSLGSFPVFSNTTVDISFNVEVPACINRIPLVNLDTSLIDPVDGTVYDREVGIYAKHTSLIYNSENIGLMEDFNVPHQKEFRKTYNLNGDLSGYRAWAWRNRLFTGINAVVNNNGLTIPGFPSDSNPARIGDLYTSSDFLGGIEIDNVGVGFTQVQTTKKSFAVNTLEQFNSIGGTKICTVDDFKTYYYIFGVNSALDTALRNEVAIDAGETIGSLGFNNDPNRDTSFDLNNILIDLNDLDVIDGFGSGNTVNEYYWIDLLDFNLEFVNGDLVHNRSEFIEWINGDSSNLNILEQKLKDFNLLETDRQVESYSRSYGDWEDSYIEIKVRVTSNPTKYESLMAYLDQGFAYHEDVFGEVVYKNLISDSVISNAGMNSMGNFFDNIPSNCYNYKAKYDGLNLRNNRWINIDKIDDETVRMDFDVEATWINDIGMILDVYAEKDYDVETSWNWEGLADVAPEILAACVYNWDECINKEVLDGGKKYYEVADCGMGPPSALEQPSEKDAARGRETLNQPVTVYRTCTLGDNWISAETTHACSDGQIYKCQFSPSVDAVSFVEKALVGDKVKNIGNRAYVCTRGGTWEPIFCGI